MPSMAVLRKSRMVSCVVAEVWVAIEIVVGGSEEGDGAAESMIFMARREVVLSEIPKRRRASEICS